MRKWAPRKVLSGFAALIALAAVAVSPATASAAPTLTLTEDCSGYPPFHSIDIDLEGLAPNEQFMITLASWGSGIGPVTVNADENGSFHQGWGSSVPETYTVTIEWAGGTLEKSISPDCTLPSGSPTADAGADQTVDSKATASLDGSGSTDPDGDLLSYDWTQTGGPPVALSGAGTATPSFAAPTGPAALDFRLEVCDDGSPQLCEDDSVTVKVKGPPVTEPPVLTLKQDCDEYPPKSSMVVAVTGLPGYEPFTGTLRSYDENGDPSVTTGPFEFHAEQDGSFLLDLGRQPVAINDGYTYEATIEWAGGILVASTVVDCTPAAGAPVPDAGKDQKVASEALVSLDGSGSSDPDGDPLTYSWTQIGGSPVSLSGANSAKPTFTAPVGPVTLTFELEVCDDGGPPLCRRDTVSVIVNRSVIDSHDYSPRVIVNNPPWGGRDHHHRRSFVVKLTKLGDGPFSATAEDVAADVLVDGEPTGSVRFVSAKVVKPDKRVKFRYAWRYTGVKVGDEVEFSGCVDAAGNPDDGDVCASRTATAKKKPGQERSRSR